MMRSESRDILGPPIEAVLIHYGAKSVPGGVGWCVMRCPFHDDGMASASVNQGLNAFKCHACGVSGDAIKLVKDREGIGFEAACEFARTVLGTSFEQVPRSVQRSRKRKPIGRERWAAVSS